MLILSKRSVWKFQLPRYSLTLVPINKSTLNFMATITFKGNNINTSGNLPQVGAKAIDFDLVKGDLSTASLADFKGQKLILNIFPSVDTGICAASVRHFNQDASNLENTAVLCISRDLPFAQARFCGAEGLKNVVMLSDFAKGDFGQNYGLEILEGPLKNLHARAVIVLNENQEIIYEELVPEIGQEPNYEAALNAVK
jgi:thiol peroxidase